MRILYAPGRGKKLGILQDFRKELVGLGHSVDILQTPYDTGALPRSSLITSAYDWWIGLSLGASLLCYVFPLTEKLFRPGRITAINPFFDRRKLASQRNFSLADQWDFTLAGSKIDIPSFDVVLSLADQAIPLEHGLLLSANITASQNCLITVDADHQITNHLAQRELAKVLDVLAENCGGYDGADYCFIYKQIGKF